MPQRRRQRRSKEEHRAWLNDKRQVEVVQEGNEAKEAKKPEEGKPQWNGLTAEADLRAYYEAQQLFGEGPAAEAEFQALWRTLRLALPVSVTLDPFQPALGSFEERLAADGWTRRPEFNVSGLSVWQMDSRRYAHQAGVKKWTERENRRGNLHFQELVSMLPALLLSPESRHLCMDMCAAPGSKTVQLLRLLRSGGPAAARPGGDAAPPALPEGAVLASELDAHRACVILPRALQKAASPASCATVANAQHFPALLGEDQAALRFDRILADVPCSGDGTLRKNAQVWNAWRRRESLELFSKQRNILLRALYLLPYGGVCAYSTCSLNPLENEAVVLSALRRWQRDNLRDASVELLDAPEVCRERCGLKPDAGLTTWLVPSPSRGGALFRSWEEVPAEMRTGHPEAKRCPLRHEMFADEDGGPEVDRALQEQLRRCARFYPQRNDTGGFFVALFRKSALPESRVAERGAPQQPAAKGEGWGRMHPLLKAEWRRVREEDAEWKELRDFYGLDDAWAKDKFQRGLLFWQSMGGAIRRLSLVSEGVARIFDASPSNRKPLSWVRLGVFLFEMLPKKYLMGVAASRWQICAEGADLAKPLVSRRVVTLSAEVFAKLLAAEHRQASVDGLPGALEGVGLLEERAQGSEGERRHVCGGVLIVVEGGAAAAGDADVDAQEELVGPGAAVPGALTPRLLRILVDNQEAGALAAAPGAAAAEADADAGEDDPAASVSVEVAALKPRGAKQPPAQALCCWSGIAQCWTRIAGAR